MATINNVVNKNIGLGLSPKDILILSAAKLGSEKITAPYIGIESVKSGAVKLGIAIGATFLTKNKYVRLVAVGVGLDGAEDLAEVAYRELNKNKEKIITKDNGLRPVL